MFAFDEVGDEERDDFFGELVGTEVVGAACGDDVHVKSVVVGAGEHVAAGFAGAVGAVGLKRSFFGEELVAVFEGETAVDLVG